eukprot:scaffold96837_cov68-Phaeocystis_antarctica.AAC.2
MALRHAQLPPSEAASRRSPCQPRPCASTGGLGVVLGQATSCFEAAANHGDLVRGVVVLPPDHAAGAVA